jgi:ubiquinone/menaquinone biosynthesis C-methylase UbiE/uncharacterized protein YbaR (Trm112 family)
MIGSPSQFLDLLACSRCHSPLQMQNDALVCSSCKAKFEIRNGIPSFLPAAVAERFAVAQAAEEKHHAEAWTDLKVGYLPWVKSLDDYRDWLESFYRVGLTAFGFPTGFFKGKAVIEIGSGPYGMLACVPHGRGLAIDPLMPSFVAYMRDRWAENPVRVAAIGEELPARAEAFDAAVAINCLDHTMEPQKILAELRRVLKPGAVMFINNNVKSFAGVMMGRVGERLGIARLTEVFHPHAFTGGSLAAACEEAGFEVVGQYYGKAIDPAERTRDWGWKAKLRHRVENERAMWLLARKR